MKIVILDSKSMGNDLNFALLEKFGNYFDYEASTPEEVIERSADADILIINKIKLNSDNLRFMTNLKLICVFATGYDNIDIAYCQNNGIAVCNVKDYSTDSVAQTVFAMALNVLMHISENDNYVKSGEYTKSMIPNKIFPVFNELNGKTWGIVGLGNIGKKVADIAKAFGCRVIANKRTPVPEYECVDLKTVFEKSDIISVHVPLTPETKEMISKEIIGFAKKNLILINVARGLVVNEEDVTEAIEKHLISGYCCDVYSNEPFAKEHPYNRILKYDNVCFLPHMAWGAFEARKRCLNEICKNIEGFLNNESINRIV